MGFGQVEGVELFPEVSEFASRNVSGLGVTVRTANAVEEPLGKHDVLCLFKPFTDISLYGAVVESCRPRYILLGNLPSLAVPRFKEIWSHQHRIYKNFNYRLLECENFHPPNTNSSGIEMPTSA